MEVGCGAVHVPMVAVNTNVGVAIVAIVVVLLVVGGGVVIAVVVNGGGCCCCRDCSVD